VLASCKLRVWAVVLTAVTVGGFLPFAAAGPAAQAATSNNVLILDATVSGGSSSVEAQEVSAQGFTPVVVNDATWEGMTTAQFASYRAIVIGDPSCGPYGDTSYLTAALSNTATWGAAVNGNVLIIGTDPVLHSGGDPTSGPGQLVTHGIDFALAQADKTGAYLDLSCAYGDDPADTPVTLLNGIRPGGFTVDGGTSSVCYNDAHIVATHPALAGLTDADLSDWTCSVHESFNTWPADYTVLAMARNFGSSYTASDGTVGEPYILASGAGLHSFPLSLSPVSQNVSVGSTANVTAQLLDSSTSGPVPGQEISFRVESGPDAGVAGTCSPSCTTDTNGHATWAFTGSHATAGASDTVQAWIDSDGDGTPSPGEPQTTAAVTWTAPVARYVALGDSYSSGEGDGSYGWNSNLLAPNNLCHRSANAYGPLLDANSALGLGTLDFGACSGAVTADVEGPNHEGNLGSDGKPEAAQLTHLSADTTAVTLTIGGNDLGFPHVLAKCVYDQYGQYGAPGCSHNASLVHGVKIRLAAFSGGPPARTPDGIRITPLSKVLADVHARAPHARVYVANYPLLFGSKFTNGKCRVGTIQVSGKPFIHGDGMFVSAADANWLNDEGFRLASAIHNQVKAAGSWATFVNAIPRFDTHGLCDSGTSWIHQLKGTYDGGTSSRWIWAGSFHPTTTGQKAGYYRAFAAAMGR
jgi:lysophospholipase L1-like esterase